MYPPPGASYVSPRRAVSGRALLLCAALAALPGCGDARAGDIERTLAAYDEASGRVAWPGFAPGQIPFALHGASRSYLVRHPSPPEAFRRLRGFRDVFGADTVPEELRSNTDLILAGARTATVGVPEADWDPGTLAPLMIHEAFHAYQSEAHPSWTANEVDLFTYPVRSTALLELRRLETAALRRAVTAPDSVRELCWAQAFLRYRTGRFGRLPAEAAAYERRSELREGLARYMQARAAGSEPALPGDGFPPEDVRERAYAVGHAQAVLLDRMAPGWKESLTAGAARPGGGTDVAETGDGGRTAGEAEPPGLHELLGAAIGGLAARRCGPSPDEVGRSRTVARTDLADLVERDRRALAGFRDAAGWRVELHAGPAAPIWPERFDPLNVRVLDGRQVLHERWIRLSNEAVALEVLDRAALTRGVGPHPLFDGIESVSVTGLPEPAVTTAGDTLRISGPGLLLRVVGGELVREGRILRVTAPPAG